jgi:hypothetical protein
MASTEPQYGLLSNPRVTRIDTIVPCNLTLPQMNVIQVPSDEFGLHVWPSALLLADYLWKFRKTLQDKLVVELGAGIGLPGLHMDLSEAKNSIVEMIPVLHLHVRQC